MRGMLEDESMQKRKAMMDAIKEENRRLALEKKMREENEKEWHNKMDQNEIARDD